MSRLLHAARLRAVLVAALFVAVLSGVLTDGATAGSDRGSGSSFTFGTHNTHRGHARITRFADIICWQEVALPWSKRKIVRSLPGYGHHIEPGVAGEVSTSWRLDRFTVVAQESTRAAPRVKSYSPPRSISRTVLQENATGDLVAVYNTHMVQGAWNDRRKPFKQMRQVNWRKHLRVLRRELRQADRAIPVLACGDFNRAQYLGLPGVGPIRRHSGRIGLDHLYRDTRGVQASRVRTMSGAGSDHPRLVSTIRLR